MDPRSFEASSVAEDSDVYDVNSELVDETRRLLRLEAGASRDTGAVIDRSRIKPTFLSMLIVPPMEVGKYIFGIFGKMVGMVWTKARACSGLVSSYLLEGRGSICRVGPRGIYHVSSQQK